MFGFRNSTYSDKARQATATHNDQRTTFINNAGSTIGRTIADFIVQNARNFPNSDVVFNNVGDVEDAAGNVTNTFINYINKADTGNIFGFAPPTDEEMNIMVNAINEYLRGPTCVFIVNRDNNTTTISWPVPDPPAPSTGDVTTSKE